MPQGLSPPALFQTHSCPITSPGTAPALGSSLSPSVVLRIGHSTPNLCHQPLPCPGTIPRLPSDHPKASQSAVNPTAEPVPPARRCAGQAFPRAVLSQPVGITARHSPAAHACACAPLGYASTARKSEQLASIPADYIGAGNAGKRKVCESGSERCQMRCPCTAGCFRFRDTSLPQSLNTPRDRQQGLRSSAKASSQP